MSDLKYPNPAGRYAPYIVIVSVSFIIIVQGWSAFAGGFDAVSFVSNYGEALTLVLLTVAESGLSVELPVFALLYIVWRLIKRTPYPSLIEIDLDTGRHAETYADEKNNEEVERREKSKKFGWFWRLYSFIA